MSVSGILSSALFSIGAHLFQNRMHKVRSEFQQLGQDLQVGNLSAAQQDFTAIQNNLHGQPPIAQFHADVKTNNETGTGQLFTQLAQALHSGNLSTAQQLYSALQQNLEHYAQIKAIPAQSRLSVNA